MQNIAIAGFGFIGGMHAQVYQRLDQAKLACVIESNREAAQQRLKDLGLDVPIAATLEEACSSFDLDAIDICLPTDLHREFAVAAAEKGKHLFIEKPLALSLEEGQRIEQAAAEANVFAQVGHCIRFWPEYQALADFIQQGQGGRLLSLTLQRRGARPGYAAANWLNDPARSGGAALDLHIHDTDFVLSLFGAPETVSSRSIEDYSGPAHIFTRYHYRDQIVEAEGGWNYPPNWGFLMAFQALFENAAVEYSSQTSPTLRLTMGDEKPKAMPFNQPGAGDSAASHGNIQSLGGYYNELAHFIEHLEANTAPTIATLAQSNLSLRVALSEIESARLGKAIPIPQA